MFQGKELEKIFIEEGVTDGEESEPEIKPDMELANSEPQPKVPEVIGHTDSGELVVVVKGKGRGRPKGRLIPISPSNYIFSYSDTLSLVYLTMVHPTKIATTVKRP